MDVLLNVPDMTSILSQPREKMYLEVYMMTKEENERFIYSSSDDQCLTAALSDNGELTLLSSCEQQPLPWILKNYNNLLIDHVNVDLVDFWIKKPFSCTVNEQFVLVCGSVIDSQYKIAMALPNDPISKDGAIVTYEKAKFVTSDNKTVLFAKKTPNSLTCNIYQYDKFQKLFIRRIQDIKLDLPFDGHCDEILIHEMVGNTNEIRMLLRISSRDQSDIILSKTFNFNAVNVGKFDGIVTLNLSSYGMTREEWKSMKGVEHKKVERVSKMIYSAVGDYTFIVTKSDYYSRLFRLNMNNSRIDLIDSIFSLDMRSLSLMNNTERPAFVEDPTIRVLDTVIAYAWNGNLRILDVSSNNLLLSTDAKEVCHLGKRFIDGELIYQALVIGDTNDVIIL